MPPLIRLFRSFPALLATGLALAACSESPSPVSSSGTAGGSAGTAAAAGSSAAGGTTGAGSTSGGGGAGNGGAGAGGNVSGSTGNASGAGGVSGLGGASGGSSSGAVGTGCTGKALCWDFEDGKLPNGFTPYRNAGSGALVVDDSKAFGTSKYSLHAKDIQGGGPQKSVTFQLPDNWGPMLWGRMRVFTSPQRPAAHAGLFAAYYLPMGSNDKALTKLDWFEVASYMEQYMGIWHPPWPPGFPEAVYLSGTPIVLDQWVCLEWQFDAKNEADPQQAGEPRVWLDGSELAWPTKFGFAEPEGQSPTLPTRHKGTSFTTIEVGMTMWQEMPDVNNWWIDDLGIGPERIGCN